VIASETETSWLGSSGRDDRWASHVSDRKREGGQFSGRGPFLDLGQSFALHPFLFFLIFFIFSFLFLFETFVNKL
jgi:hypothetical protein